MTDTNLAEQDQLSGLLSPWLKRLRFKASLRWVQGEHLLDYGCGVAEYADWVPAGTSYTGLEHNPDIVAMARARYPNLMIIQGDVLSPEDELASLEGQRFDTIVMLAVIEHTDDPVSLVMRLAALLHPGGRLIMTTPAPIGKIVLDVTGWLGLSSRESHDEHEDLLGKADLINLVGAGGLTLTHYSRFLLGLNQIIVGQKP